MNIRQLRRNTGIVLFAAGFSHVGQLWVYGIKVHILVAAGLGLCYIMIGLGLLGQSKTSLWLGTFIPALGAAGGLLRYTSYEPDAIVLVHLAISIVVTLVCAWLLAVTYNWLPRRKQGELP